MKIKTGEKIQDCKIQIQNSKTDHLSGLFGEKPLLLIFHRFYGCVLTQYEIGRLIEEYDNWKDCPCELAFVLQSELQEMKQVESLKKFAVICDTERKLYNMFQVPMAESLDSLGQGDTMKKIAAAKEAGFVHGLDSGDPLQLPAAFVISHTGNVLYVHYGVNGGDLPSLHEMVQQIIKL